MRDADARAQLIHAESVRALDMQSTAVDEIRSRTGVLLAAASVATAFLGATALQHDGFSTVNIAATVVFVLVLVLCLWILSPADDWEFAYNATVLDEHYIAKDVTLSNMYRSMAKGYAESRVLNRERLKWRYRLFGLACFALGADVFLWLVGRP